MALKSKEPESGAPSPQTKTNQPETRPATPAASHGKINDEVEARLNPYISATSEQHQRYLQTARENPERAARLLSLKDLDSLEREYRLNKPQIDGAKQWLAEQPPEVQRSIAQRHAEISHPVMKDMRILELVLNRMKFENKVALGQRSTPAPARMAV